MKRESILLLTIMGAVTVLLGLSLFSMRGTISKQKLAAISLNRSGMQNQAESTAPVNSITYSQVKVVKLFDVINNEVPGDFKIMVDPITKLAKYDFVFNDNYSSDPGLMVSLRYDSGVISPIGRVVRESNKWVMKAEWADIEPTWKIIVTSLDKAKYGTIVMNGEIKTD